MTFKEWAIQQHRDTNHKYANIIPYEFHLEMVAEVARRFKDVWGKLYGENSFYHALYACYGHDLLEDTRVSFNDITHELARSFIGYETLIYGADTAAYIIYALTNEKGKNREERANDKYYEGIRNTPGAVFVKLCDRIANVKFSLFTGGSMLGKYEKENMHFLQSLGIFNEQRDTVDGWANPYEEMALYLIRLFKLKSEI